MPAPLAFTPACAWIIAVSAVNDGPIYTFFLEWSTTQGGVFLPFATFVLPSITEPRNFPVGVGGGLFTDRTPQWLRLRVAIGGGGRSVTFGSGLTKLIGQPGTGSTPGDIFTGAAA